MTRLKKTDNTPQQPEGLHFHTRARTNTLARARDAHRHLSSHLHTHQEQIKCFNQLATAHNEDPLSSSYQLPSATSLCLQRADFSLLLQQA